MEEEKDIMNIPLKIALILNIAIMCIAKFMYHITISLGFAFLICSIIVPFILFWVYALEMEDQVKDMQEKCENKEQFKKELWKEIKGTVYKLSFLSMFMRGLSIILYIQAIIPLL